MDLGFIRAGHEIVWANDNDKDSCKSYESHFGHKPICKPIEEIPSSDIPDADIVIGGFPCQGFSIANKYRHEGDTRNKLYLELLRVIGEKSPKYFVAENVTGLCSLGGYDSKEDQKNRLGRVLKRIIKELSNANKTGYDVSYKILDAASFEVPQRRKRVIILGTRKDVKQKLDHPVPLITDETNFFTVKKALKGIPQKSKVWKKGQEEKTKLKNHYGTAHKVKINGQLGNRKTVWHKPSPTITGRGGGTGGPVIIPHPNLQRRMTVREYARLQVFPDDFVFHGSPTSQYRQIGNAVPWKLAYHIAKMIPKK